MKSKQLHWRSRPSIQLLLPEFLVWTAAVLAAASTVVAVPADASTQITQAHRQLLQQPTLLLATADPGFNSQSSAPSSIPSAPFDVIYNCTLLVQGFGADSSSTNAAVQQGVQSADLRCTSQPRGAAPLVLGYNSSMLGLSAASLRGVEAVNAHSCQGDPFANVTALFYFCVPPVVLVQLWQPTINGVWVERPPEGIDAGLIAVGGNGTMTVHQGRFSHNHGSSMFVVATAAKLNISSSNVTGNTAQGGTAVLVSNQATVRLSDTTVSYNTANFGGAVKLSGFAKVVITDASSIFSNNATVDSSNGNGGAVYMEGDSQLVVTGKSRIVNNTSPNGGGLSLQDRSTCYVAGGAVLSHNVAFHKTGGAVFLKDAASCNISDATLFNNSAKKQGGAVGLEDGTGTKCFISNRTVVSGNGAEEQGGGLYLGSGTRATVDGGSQFNDNWAKNGGAIMLYAQDDKGDGRPVSLVVSGAGTAIRNNTATSGAAISAFAVKETDKQCVVNVTDGVEISDNASEEGGSAYVSGAMCNASFVGVRFFNNSDIKHSGVMSLYNSAKATLRRCVVSGSRAKDAAAFSIGQTASLNIVDSVVESHTAVHSGGAIRVVEDATATLVNSVLRNCTAVIGGALVISDNGQVFMSNSSLISNRARTSGGAVHMLGPGTSRLFLANGSLCSNNTANVSGGCAYLATGGLLVADNSSFVKDNIARYGGGIALTALDTPPDLHQLQRSVLGNQAAMFSPDIYVDWADVILTVQHIMSDGVSVPATLLADPDSPVPYVSRSSGSGLNVSLQAKGNKGTQAAAGIRIEAQIILDGGATAREVAAISASSTTQTMAEDSYYQTTILGSSTTDNQGIALFPNLQPIVTPGNYSLNFQYMTLDGIPYSRTVMLHSRPCMLGEVTGLVDVARTCDICASGSYSLSTAPFNKRCQLCNIQTANCSEGGAVVVPQPGFWQRSPDSAVMHRCLNPAACLNNHTRLLQLHPYRNLTQQAASLAMEGSHPALLAGSSMSDSSSLNLGTGLGVADMNEYIQAQCAPGYTGPLCASCQQGHGTTRQSTCSRCMPLGRLTALYILGALALMCIIRAMLYLSTSSDSNAIKCWTAAALRCRAPASSSRKPVAPKDVQNSAAAAERSMSLAEDTFAATQQSSCSSSAAVPHCTSPFESSDTFNTVMLQQQVPPVPSSVLKVLILYMQYMLIIGSLAVDWPTSMSRPFTVLAGLWSTANSEAFLPDCLIPGNLQANSGTNSQLTASVAASEGGRVPARMLQVVVYISVPIVMYLAVLLLECMLRATQSWWQPVCHRCKSDTSESAASKEWGFMPGFKSWRQAQLRSYSPTAHQLPKQQNTTHTESERRHLEEVVMEISPAVTTQAGVPAPARVAGGPVSSSSPGLHRFLPSAAWCGVLAMVVVFFFLTSLARVALSLFMCFTLEEDSQAVREGHVDLTTISLWMMNPLHECWSAQHKAWALGLGIPLVMLLYIALPLLVAVLLFRYRSRLTDSWVQQHFGFLYVHYRPQYCLWEVVTILQALLVVVVSVTANHLGVYNQTLLLNVVLAVIFAMLLICKPMASRQVQLLSYASVGVQLFTTYAALSFLVASHSVVATAEASKIERSLEIYDAYKFIMGVIVLLANLAFMMALILVLLSTLPWPSALWSDWRMLTAQRCKVVASCLQSCGVGGDWQTPTSSGSPPLSAAYTSSGRPVLVWLEAQNAVQMAATGHTQS